MRVLYLFAGAKRKSGFGPCLRKLARTAKVPVDIQEHDLLRGGHRHNLLLGTKRRRWLKLIREGRYSMVIASPPCGTFSRARWANKTGPPPLRMKYCPRGFPWLRGPHKEAAKQANQLADYTFEALEA